MNLQNMQLLQTGNLIGGTWVGADSGERLSVINPANGEKLADVPLCGAAETRRAIEAANAAWPAWRALTARRRSQILQAWNRLILDNADDPPNAMRFFAARYALEMFPVYQDVLADMTVGRRKKELLACGSNPQDIVRAA